MTATAAVEADSSSTWLTPGPTATVRPTSPLAAITGASRSMPCRLPRFTVTVRSSGDALTPTTSPETGSPRSMAAASRLVNPRARSSIPRWTVSSHSSRATRSRNSSRASRISCASPTVSAHDDTARVELTTKLWPPPKTAARPSRIGTPIPLRT